MPEAGHVEDKIPVLIRKGQPCGVQTEHPPQLRTGKRNAADAACRCAAARASCRLSEPGIRASAQLHVRVFLHETLREFLRREDRLRGKARRSLLPRAFHRLQIRHIRAPDRHRCFRCPARAGKINRVNQLSVIRQNLPCCLPDRLARRTPNRIKGRAIFLPQPLLACPRLTAGSLRADVRVFMLRLQKLPTGKRPCCNCLRFARLGFKVCRHFAEQHPCQIVLHGKFCHRAVIEQANRLCIRRCLRHNCL